MKKCLLTLTVLTLLAGCEEPVTNTTPGDVEDEAHFEETSAKVMAPQPFYIADLSVDEEGDYLLTQNPVRWLSEEEGSCRSNGAESDDLPSMPECNPNGYLIIEGTTTEFVTIPEGTYVHVSNLAMTLGMKEDMAENVITMEELLAAFEANPDFFTVTPFELVYGTVTVDGVEMSDQISGINEIYIP